jgi:hypothetical protein
MCTRLALQLPMSNQTGMPHLPAHAPALAADLYSTHMQTCTEQQRQQMGGQLQQQSNEQRAIMLLLIVMNYVAVGVRWDGAAGLHTARCNCTGCGKLATCHAGAYSCYKWARCRPWVCRACKACVLGCARKAVVSTAVVFLEMGTKPVYHALQPTSHCSGFLHLCSHTWTVFQPAQAWST